MVDMGWPWWVSSLLAAGVLLAALVVFLRARGTAVRAVAATIAVQAAVGAVVAPFLMPSTGSSMAGGSMGGDSSATTAMEGASSTSSMSDDLMGGMEAGKPARLPFTFFFTRYELLGDPDQPTGVRYHSDGTPRAGAPDGTSISLLGSGGWDPTTALAKGGGVYTIESPKGTVQKRGSWEARRFVSFRQLPGWWGPGFEEEGWQGPPGSPSFSGVLTLAVRLEGRGDATLRAWCVMSEEAQRMAGRSFDGVTVTGPGLRFADSKPNVGRLEGGVMFYGPGSS